MCSTHLFCLLTPPTYCPCRHPQVDYTLSTLARNLLKQDRADLSPTDIPGGCPLR